MLVFYATGARDASIQPALMSMAVTLIAGLLLRRHRR